MLNQGMGAIWPVDVLQRPAWDLNVSHDIARVLYRSGIQIIAQVLLMGSENIVRMFQGTESRFCLELMEQTSRLSSLKESYFDGTGKIKNEEKYKKITMETLGALGLSERARGALARHGVGDLYTLIENYNEKFVLLSDVERETVDEINRFMTTLDPKDAEGRALAVDEAYKNTEVDRLELPVQVRNALHRNGIDDLYTLIIRYRDDGLASCVRVGEGTREKIGTFLRRLNAGEVRVGEPEGLAEIEVEMDGELPPDILSRPVKDLLLSAETARAIQGAGIGTVGQALGLGAETPFAAEYPASWRELRGQLRRLKELGEGFFVATALDGAVVEKLARGYGLRQSMLAVWLEVSTQRVSMKLRPFVNRGRWQGSELSDVDKGVFLGMAEGRQYFQKVGPRKYAILNNRKDDAALLVIADGTVKCWFLAELPEDLRGALKDTDMHRLSERENPQKPLGKVISILKKQYFCPDNPNRFRRLAAGRKMRPDEYSQWRFGMPCSMRAEGQVTDEKVLECFEKNLVDGRVRIPATPENRWIRTYGMRQGFSMRELIEFYGYKGTRSPAAI